MFGFVIARVKLNDFIIISKAFVQFVGLFVKCCSSIAKLENKRG